MNFLDSFDSKECLLDIKNMQYESSMKSPLFLLALAYQKSGNYSKAIELYLYLLKNSEDISILENLAYAYFKAGFLKKALNIYLKILKDYPRKKEALYQLEYIYEKLNSFEDATDALNVLEAQGEDISALRVHLKFQEILKNFKKQNEKFELFAKLLNSCKSQKSFIVRELFKIDSKRAWRYYKDEYFTNLIDILNNLEKEQIDLDIISKNVSLSQLFYIKSYIKSCERESGFFALDILSSAKRCGVENGELKFIYLCKKCKNNYPLAFLRCPNCHRAFSSKIEVTVEKKQQKSNYSLQ